MPVPNPYADRLATLRTTDAEVVVAGVPTRYWVCEHEDVPRTRTMVAVHGFRGDHHGLEPIVAHLPGVRVISPDLPGFGESGAFTGRRHDLEAYSQWLREFVAAVAPGAIVLGHSFGSIVASAAVADGLETDLLILVNPIGAPALEGPRAILTRLAILYYRAGAALPRRLGEGLLRNRVIVRAMSIAMLKSSDHALRRFVHDQHDRYFSGFADRDTLRDAFITSVSHDVREFAPRIDVPTLLVAAVRDDITPIAAQRTLVHEFPQARLVEISDVGHLIHYEKPAEAARAIEDFVTAGGTASPQG